MQVGGKHEYAEGRLVNRRSKKNGERKIGWETNRHTSFQQQKSSQIMLIDLSVMISYQHLNGKKHCNRDTVRTKNTPHP